MGLMLGPANTDAINRASRYSYGEATGITQTVRNYGASLGFAILGTVLITRFRSRSPPRSPPGACPVPPPGQAAKLAQLQGGNGNVTADPQSIRADFASATRDVLYGMASSWRRRGRRPARPRRGVQEDTTADQAGLASNSAEDPGADLDPAWR